MNADPKKHIVHLNRTQVTMVAAMMMIASLLTTNDGGGGTVTAHCDAAFIDTAKT